MCVCVCVCMCVCECVWMPLAMRFSWPEAAHHQPRAWNNNKHFSRSSSRVCLSNGNVSCIFHADDWFGTMAEEREVACISREVACILGDAVSGASRPKRGAPVHMRALFPSWGGVVGCWDLLGVFSLRSCGNNIENRAQTLTFERVLCYQHTCEVKAVQKRL
jgi:hypothetical protein